MAKLKMPDVLILDGHINEIIDETRYKLALSKKEEDRLHILTKRIEVASAMLDEYMLTITRRLERSRTYSPEIKNVIFRVLDGEETDNVKEEKDAMERIARLVGDSKCIE